MTRAVIPAALAAGLFIAGCAAPNASNNRYSANAVTMTARTIEAVIVSKRLVQIDGTSALGGGTGSAIGAVAGSSLGSNGRDNLAGAIVGAVVGGVAGAVIEANATKQSAYEYIIKSDVTGLMTLIQSDSDFSVGDSVFVVLASKPVMVKNVAPKNN